MNMQSHTSGRTSGKAPNQEGVKPQQTGNVQLPNSGGDAAGSFRNPIGRTNSYELSKMRQQMQAKVFSVLQQRQPASSENANKAKLMDVARKLEEGLLKTAPTQEAYLDLQTLEARLANLIKHYTHRRANSSSSVATMIPTPGMPHGGNPNLTAASTVDSSRIATNGCSSVASMAVNTGSLLPTTGIHGCYSSKSDGTLSGGYKQLSAGLSFSSGINFSSHGSQRMTGQMIPTPGFNNNNGNGDCQSHMNVDTSTCSAGLSAVESPVVPPSLLQRQHAARQNSPIMQNNQLGTGFRSGLQQKSYVLMTGAQDGGLGMNGNKSQLANECRNDDDLPSAAHFAKSAKPPDQPQQPRLHGEGHAVRRSGNIYGTVTSARSTANTQKISSTSLKSMPSVSSSMASNRSNLLDLRQVPQIKAQSADQLENKSFHSSFPSRASLPRVHRPQQFLQEPHQFQHQQQFQQHQQDKIQQQQHLLNENADTHPQVASTVVTEVKPESGVDQQIEVQQSLASEQCQHPELQNQIQQNSAEGCNGGAQQDVPIGKHHIHPPLTPQSQQMQHMLHQHPLPLVPCNNFGSISAGVQSDMVQVQRHSQSEDMTLISGNSTLQNAQENAYQRMPMQHEAPNNDRSTGGTVFGQTIDPRSTAVTLNPTNPSGVSSKSGNENHVPKFRNQQRWLLFLLHARKCNAPEGKCQAPDCISVRKLLRHMDDCKVPQCTYPRCSNTMALVSHYNRCKDPACPVCVSVRNYLRQQAKAFSNLRNESGLLSSNGASSTTYGSGLASGRTISKAPDTDISDLQPSLKRLKVEQFTQSNSPVSESSLMSVSAETEALSSKDAQPKDNKQNGLCTAVKSEITEMNVEMSNASGQANHGVSGIKETEDIPKLRPVRRDEPVCAPKGESIRLEKEINPLKEENTTESTFIEFGSKSGKSKIKGVSLTELFTPEQIREHIRGLRQWVGQSKAKAEKNQAMERSMTENSCQLCAVERLTFEPPPMYCTPCGARIKRNAMYYTVGTGEGRQYICVPCYNEARGETIVADGTPIPKARFEKKKHDEETEEWWVQCDKCEGWQHQICALFNGRRNDGGQAEYTCANCYIQEVERGERKPLPQSAVLGAKDLPRTILSDHIEQRLFKGLKQERQERARAQGKSYDEVPGAEALVVRVVSSVDKKLEVKPRFLELFREENYPTEVPYKSKALLLFQKIEGVEVCLFGMYVQEFGTDCAVPNQRRVYLSYLDSVKYFRPEVKTVNGEALRTFVYHEILIGYLEYCKKRGFTSCYIWACPPLKGEDYILYCHPEIQKTPRSDKLREWYLSMLRKATQEKVVVECTNLYDHFFTQNGECRTKVTAGRLPYFDGDYWPGAAEDLIYQMNQEEDDKKIIKKGTTKKIISKRAAKASGPSDLPVNLSKDLQLMQRLGGTICPMKEDFIMVHLQHCCTHCCILMVSGNRWVCNHCKNFQICDKCYEAEQNREDRERHLANQKEKHNLYPVVIADVPVDTKDKDEILESEFFDTRQAFLSLCQGNHYQYETLRRAKHSSMMILYHLHNPTAPAFVTTCNVCQLDIETGQGWRCEVCPDYDVCGTCYSKGINHPHKLMHHPSNADRDAQNKEARQLRVQQLRKMLDLLVHASQCRLANCQYPNCRRVKSLFRHGMQCKTRASGGCVLCKKMWYLLQIHARACKDSGCCVPRCRDLKEHWKRQQQQSDSRRRAAVMEMMRQRAAENAGTSG